MPLIMYTRGRNKVILDAQRKEEFEGGADGHDDEGAEMWVQKSKLWWLDEGDKKSSFFHRGTSTRKNRSYIALLEDSNGCPNDREIEKEIIGYFTKLYGCRENKASTKVEFGLGSAAQRVEGSDGTFFLLLLKGKF